MKIKYRRKKLPEWLVLFILVMPFVLPLLTEVLRLPSLLKYTLDIAWIILLGYMCIHRLRIPNKQAFTLWKVTLLFFVLTFVGFLFHYQSIVYYLWGLRNNIRFFVFFFACIFFLSQQSIENYLTFFDKVFWLNIPVVLIQYFVLREHQDNIGGIFGTEVGCNGYMNIFLVIVVAKSVLYFVYKKEKLKICLLKCSIALLIAILSELKMFFVELLLIVFLAMFMTQFTFRKIGIAAMCIAGVFVGARLVSFLFPDFSGWFSLEGIMKIISSEKGYTGRNDINRLTAIAYTLRKFLPTTFDKLFGLGLGNCDHATFYFLTTPFYRTYKWTRYFWFSSSFLAVETGLIGLFVYVSFFVSLFFCADKREKTTNSNLLYCQLAKIMSVLCIVMIAYNSSLRAETAYMMYFVLSLPFARQVVADGNKGHLQGG